MMSRSTLSPPRDLHPMPAVEIHAAMRPEYFQILTPDALNFIAGLCSHFENRRQDLLLRRRQRQAEIDAGHYLPERIHGSFPAERLKVGAHEAVSNARQLL